jgi:hypothetical protein
VRPESLVWHTVFFAKSYYGLIPLATLVEQLCLSNDQVLFFSQIQNLLVGFAEVME